MNTDTIRPNARTVLAAPAERPRATAGAGTGSHHVADYIVDVFFVVLLAAPFVIFKSPASVEDAVVPVHAQQVADAPYGPE